MKTNQTFESFKAELNNHILSTGMTFNPSIDCRNDLVNFYGYTREQVNTMSDNQVFSIMDQIEDAEKGYSPESELTLPIHVQDKKCSCGGELKVLLVDCETRGDCEIYHCECLTCGSEVSFNYAEEWFTYDIEEAIHDRIMDIDNACFNGWFEKAKSIIIEVTEMIQNYEGDKNHLNESLDNKLNYLTKRYNISFEENQNETIEQIDTRSIDDLDFSVRTYNCLNRANYKTAQQVKNASLLDMQKVRNLGTSSLQEIEEVLNIKFS